MKTLVLLLLLVANCEPLMLTYQNCVERAAKENQPVSNCQVWLLHYQECMKVAAKGATDA